jgi:DNA (cytosine-5)-methyltransferase 1
VSKLKVLSLFSGIAGLCELGIKVAGLESLFEIAHFVEIDSFCQKVLKKHYPNIPINHDIREFKAERGEYDIIVGGSPCQDISCANPNATGFDGKRSGLWYEMFRIIDACRPRAIIWENVGRARYKTKGGEYSPLGIVIGNLASLGYICEWHTITASSVGAVHKRERVFLIAY